MKKFFLLFFFVISLVSSEAVETPALKKASHTSKTTPIISLSSIIEITYANNKGIESVRYDLEAAEYAFKQFERGLSQFTPFIMNSSASRRTRTYPSDEEDDRRTDYDYKTRVGMQKEFFNGSSISGFIGYQGEAGYGGEGSHGFAEAEYRFPLFSSYTTLRRITARTFEENEVFNARLDYVDTVRDTIQGAQERYFWLQVMLERYDVSLEALKDYQALLGEPILASRSADRRLLEDEIKSIQYDVTKYEGDINSYRVLLQDRIGLVSLSLSRVNRIDLYTGDYYGKSYLTCGLNQVIQEARENDAEVRVLALARENSELKKDLAQKGKWDIFGRINGYYDMDGEEDYEDYSGYDIGIGIDIRLIDPAYLGLSSKRAEAEINKYTSKIERRERELKNLIEREHSQAVSLKQQADELKTSIKSRREVFGEKRSSYLSERETMDNLLSARKSLFDSQIRLTSVLGEFFEIITELDQATGVYFQELGLSIEQTEISKK